MFYPFVRADCFEVTLEDFAVVDFAEQPCALEEVAIVIVACSVDTGFGFVNLRVK